MMWGVRRLIHDVGSGVKFMMWLVLNRADDDREGYGDGDYSLGNGAGDGWGAGSGALYMDIVNSEYNGGDTGNRGDDDDVGCGCGTRSGNGWSRPLGEVLWKKP